MAIVAEFSVPADIIALGRALDGDLTAELERVVPTREGFMPYAWLFGEEFEGFESRMAADPEIAAVSCLADVEGGRLYEFETTGERPAWAHGVLAHEFTILEGHGSADRWEFHLRFPDADEARAFHGVLTDHDVPNTLENVHRLEEAGRGATEVVTPKQREALLLALREGYFEQPRQVSLEELGERLGIAPSSVSARLRRGYAVMVRKFLEDPGFEFG